jgi:hypothetical protein
MGAKPGISHYEKNIRLWIAENKRDSNWTMREEGVQAGENWIMRSFVTSNLQIK